MQLTVAQRGADEPLFAANYTYSATQGTALNVNNQNGVLSNDTFPEGQTLTALLVSGPSNGALNLNTDGSFTYTGNAGFTGTDSFSYLANDELANSNVATVTLTVRPVQPPVAQNDTYVTTQGNSLNVGGGQGVLANDSDPQGRALTAVLLAGPADGTLVLNNNGQFPYTPNAGFSGTDSFTYQDTNGLLNSNVATVTLTVTPVAPPVAVNYSYTLNPDTTLNMGGGGPVEQCHWAPGLLVECRAGQ